MKKKILTILLSLLIFVNLITNAFSMAQTYDYSDYLTKQEFNSKIDSLETRVAMLNANYKSDISTNIVNFYKDKATNPFIEGNGVRVITKNSETDRIRWKITNSFDAMPYFSKRGPWHIQEIFITADDIIVGLLELHREMTVYQGKTSYHSEGYFKGVRDTSDSSKYVSSGYKEAPLPYVSDSASKDAWIIIDYYGPEQSLDTELTSDDFEKTDSGFINVRVLTYDTTNLVFNCFSQYTASLNVKTQEWSGWRQIGSEFDYFAWFDYSGSNHMSLSGIYNRFVENSFSTSTTYAQGQNNNFPGYKNTSGVWAMCFMESDGTGLTASPTNTSEYFLVHAVPYFYDFGNNTSQSSYLALQLTAYSYRGGVYQMTLNNGMIGTNRYGEWIRLDSRNEGGFRWTATNVPMSSLATAWNYGNIKFKDNLMSIIDISAIQLNDTMYFYSMNMWFTLAVTTAQATWSGRTQLAYFNKSLMPYSYSGATISTNPVRYSTLYPASIRTQNWPDSYHNANLEFVWWGRYLYITNPYGTIPVAEYRYHLTFTFLSYSSDCFSFLKGQFGD